MRRKARVGSQHRWRQLLELSVLVFLTASTEFRSPSSIIVVVVVVVLVTFLEIHVNCGIRGILFILVISTANWASLGILFIPC